MKKVIILGSTGSLGIQTLELLEKHQNDFKVLALSANENEELLNEQAKHFEVHKTALASREGEEALIDLATEKEADIIINNLSGIAGIEPSIAALKAGKQLLLSNKETIVAEGSEIMRLAKKSPHPDAIIPVDSEHNAIFEILKKFPQQKPQKITLPCSGGPFLGKTSSELENVTVKQALAHPKWSMGQKISIESATLLNKGLEVIEAHYLFGLSLEQIEVKIHPECLIHALVEFQNGKTYAYLSPPDMRHHIENALLHSIGKTNNSHEIRELKDREFQLNPPDHETFPGITLVKNAYQRNPQSMRSFLQIEERAVGKFLNGGLAFSEICKEIERCLPQFN